MIESCDYKSSNVQQEAFWIFSNLQASGEEVRTLINTPALWKAMVKGISNPSIVIKKDACYALKNFTFCADCELLEQFYHQCPEVIEILMDNHHEMFDNIVVPCLSSLENLLYVFEKDRERTDPENQTNLVLEACRDLPFENIRQKMNHPGEVVKTISTRMWNRYFEDDEEFNNGGMLTE